MRLTGYNAVLSLIHAEDAEVFCVALVVPSSAALYYRKSILIVTKNLQFPSIFNSSLVSCT
jgi:hypothetical protein